MFNRASSPFARHGVAACRVRSVAIAATLLATPMTGFGQDTSTSQPPAQDPGATSPASTTSPAPPPTPTTTPPTTPAAEPASGETLVPRLTFNPGDYPTDFSPGESPTSPYVEMEEIEIGRAHV